MLKMLAGSFFVFLLVFFGLVFTGYASAAEFTANGNIMVSSVSGTGITADLLIMSGSAASSWQYDSGVFSISSPDGTAGFQVGSSDSSVACLVVRDNANSSVAQASNSVPGTSYVSLPTTAGTYTVIPSTGGCSNSSATPPSSSSGGGGGPSTYVPPPPTTPVVSVLPPVVGGMVKFTATLTAGVTNPRVRDLQRFLNQSGFPVALTGPGSFGNETFYFGPATKIALRKFQQAKGIIKSPTETGAGRLGPVTMATINALVGGNQASGLSATVPSVVPNTVTASQLQQLLQMLRGYRAH